MRPAANKARDGEAEWLARDFPYELAQEIQCHAFVTPGIRRHKRLLLTNALGKPTTILRMLGAGSSLADIAKLLVWEETARLFGVTRVIQPGGVVSSGSTRLYRGNGAQHQQPRESPGRPALTGVLIALDEQDTIAAALTSLQPYVDELVVLDGGSVDATVAIAESLDAKVHHRRFESNFADQRNAALDFVRTPWVISLDCDERLTAGLGDLVQELLPWTRADAILVPRLNLVGDEPRPIQWPDIHPRVHRANLRYTGRVHEDLHYRRPIFTPVNGPHIEHHKTRLRALSGWLRYADFNPQMKPSDTAAFRAEYDRLKQAHEE